MKKNASATKGKRLVDNDFDYAEIVIDSHRPPHFSDSYEIEIYTGGNGYQLINGNRYEFGENVMFIYHPNDYREVFAGSPLSLINIAFSNAIIDEESVSDFFEFESEIAIELTEHKVQEVQTLCSLINDIFHSNRSNKNHILAHLLNALLLIVVGSEQRHALIGKNAMKNDVLQYIHKNFADSPTLDEVSEYSGYQKNYFCEVFKKKTGMTYIEYLTAYKLNYAKKLLKVTQKSIKEIAIESGFSSSNNFIREFKRKNNMTPKQFRNKYRE